MPKNLLLFFENEKRLPPDSFKLPPPSPVVPPTATTPSGDDPNQFLRLSVGGTLVLLLQEAIRRANKESFLNKFLGLPHRDRCKVRVYYLL